MKRHPLDPLRLIQKYINEQPRLREWLTRMRHGTKDRDVTLFGRQMRINALRENGYYRASRLVAANSLMRDETLVLQRVSMFLGDGVTFVDVGANIGIFSSVIADAKRVFRDFRVVAFEANPATFERLQVNAATFGFEAVNVALAGEAGQLDFATGAVSGIATVSDHAGAAHIAGRGFSVEARRLDSFNLGDRLVIKIDVEHMEYDVLQGARGLFEAGKVAAVYLDDYDDRDAVVDFLRHHGFDLFGPFRLMPYRPGVRALLAVKAG